MHKAPKVTIDGVKYEAKVPKLKVYREIVKLKDSKASIESQEGLDQTLELFIRLFDNEAVTKEKLEEVLDIGDLYAMFYQSQQWLAGVVTSKMEQLSKNAEKTV